MLAREPGAPLEQRFLDFIYQPIVEADGSVSGVFAAGDVAGRPKTLTRFFQACLRPLLYSLATVSVWTSSVSFAVDAEESRIAGGQSVTRAVPTRDQFGADTLAAGSFLKRRSPNRVAITRETQKW